MCIRDSHESAAPVHRALDCTHIYALTACKWPHTHVCYVYISVYIYVNIYIYIYVYIYLRYFLPPGPM